MLFETPGNAFDPDMHATGQTRPRKSETACRKYMDYTVYRYYQYIEHNGDTWCQRKRVKEKTGKSEKCKSTEE
jgi:hypothetical protein